MTKHHWTSSGCCLAPTVPAFHEHHDRFRFISTEFNGSNFTWFSVLASVVSFFFGNWIINIYNLIKLSRKIVIQRWQLHEKKLCFVYHCAKVDFHFSKFSSFLFFAFINLFPFYSTLLQLQKKKSITIDKPRTAQSLE